MDKRIKRTWLVDLEGNAREFKSMYSAAAFLDVSKGSITYNMDKNKMLKGFLVVSKYPADSSADLQTKIDVCNQKKEYLDAKHRKKTHLLEYYKEELEAVFRKLGYYDLKKLSSIKNGLSLYGTKVN